MARRGTKADNVGKAARANTTAAARTGYRRGRQAAPESAAEGKTGVAAVAPAAPAATGRAANAAARKAAEAGAPDYPPPAPIDHSAQALDTPPPVSDAQASAAKRKGAKKKGSRSRTK